MKLQELAANLVSAQSEKEREDLLETPKLESNLDLAFALKEICYQSWTTEPTRAQSAAAALKTLAKFDSHPKINALKTWINGIAALTRGENASAVKLLDEAADNLRDLNESHLAAQTQVAKLYALALLGRYEEAIDSGKAALAVFQAHKDELSAGKIEKNLGNLLGRRDRYREAEEFFESARLRFLALGEARELAMAENSLALIKTFQNDFRTAEKLYEQSLNRAKAENMRVTEAEIEASLGNLSLYRGLYDAALKYLEASRRKYAALGMPHQAAVANLELAEVYLELNLIAEAIEIFEEIAAQFAALEMRAEEARTRTQFGKALARLDQTEIALIELEQAEKIYLAEENPVGAANVRLIKANLHLRSFNFEAAKILSQEAAQVFKTSNAIRSFLLAQFLLGEAERFAGNLAAAQEVFTGIIKTARQNEQPQIIWLAEKSLGLLAVSDSDEQAAEKHFSEAVEIIENLRSPLAADEFRTAFFADKLEPYEKLADICRQNPARIPESLVWVERARSQALLDLLGNETKARENLTELESEKRLQQLHEELNWFYSRLNRPASGDLREARDETENWQEEIRKREKEINSLILHLNAENKPSSRNESLFDLEKLQKLLGDERLLIEFTEFDGEFAAFVVGENGVELIENLGTSEEVQRILEQIHFQFGTLRYGAKTIEKHLPILKRRIDSHLQNLYQILLEPIENLLDDKQIIFIPTGNLHYIPFHALFDGEKYVIELRGISIAPSAAVLQSLLERKGVKYEKVLAVGFADERVPQVENEIYSLTNVLPEVRTLIGEHATLAAIRENLYENFDVLHLACHGQFRAGNPLFSSLHLADGWATVREAANLRLQNSLVVLSACETGLSEIAAGDELLGMVRGFLAAGASSLLMSLWTVNDEATAALMRDFYQNIKSGKNLAAALRQAQLNFIQQNSHPYFWSPFTLVGKW